MTRRFAVGNSAPLDGGRIAAGIAASKNSCVDPHGAGDDPFGRRGVAAYHGGEFRPRVRSMGVGVHVSLSSPFFWLAGP